ncbi:MULTISPECIES: hypothetical protein [unclassified Kitasatospora]|uniref:hypothetical protein n=1 Tax=unclassified Kitasatospora TaxID=2633591 RepID=UPI00340AABAA
MTDHDTEPAPVPAPAPAPAPAAEEDTPLTVREAYNRSLAGGQEPSPPLAEPDANNGPAAPAEPPPAC